MARLVFDIETSALPLGAFDEAQQEYLFRDAAKIEDETLRLQRRAELERLLTVFRSNAGARVNIDDVDATLGEVIPPALRRTSSYLTHPVFAESYAPPTGDCVTSTPNCNQPLESPTSGLAAAAGANVANDPVVFTAKSNPGASAFKHSR